MTSQVVFGKRVYHCHQVVTRTRAFADAAEVLTSAICKRRIGDSKLLSRMIDVSSELKTSTTEIVENTQCLLEFDTNNFTEKSTPALLSSRDKLKIKAKNVRLTSRELTQTLKKYSFLCEERTSEKNHAGALYGTPVSRGVRGLRDRTNSPVSFQKKIGTEFGSPTPEVVVLLRSKESPI